MVGWSDFEKSAPDIASAGRRLLELNDVAFLATVSKTGRPRIHPFVPKIVSGRLVAFVMDSSPKIADLRQRTQFSIHALPGAEDEEFFVSGESICCDTNGELRKEAAKAMGFVTGVDEHHILFEFTLDRALWTKWLDFGTPNHRPHHQRWMARPAPGSV
jgi:hypothetical protein